MHWAYLAMTNRALGPLTARLLGRWRVQPERELVNGLLATARRDDADPRVTDGAALRRAFDAEGYVVVRDLVPGAMCERARAAFAAEVKPYRGPLYRQTRAAPPSGTSSAIMAICSIRSSTSRACATAVSEVPRRRPRDPDPR